ncbi:uncharacterized protein BDV17DRAFT_229802 [Aspergillus undulatus]|uniref:uncharacterized protein n=1 Tax=Aspergillus undulatus TaxID=1810928 RepID=UPI003CCD2B8F
MVSFNPLSFFKSSKESTTDNANANPTFDPDTLQMVQPGNAPNMTASNQGVVSEQPRQQEQMNTSMQLRGGGQAGFCCGICAGLACFECCEICC